MLAPLSWLKEYVDITLKPNQLGELLTEVGLGLEKLEKTDNDVIFELEITPNRPDWLSMIGVAREIAAIEQKTVRYPKLKSNLKPSASRRKELPLTIKTNPKINPRFTALIIDGVTIKESPQWLKSRLTQIGQRPICNIVDITNYVMFELGNPLHAFDYDKIAGHMMIVEQTKGAEEFKSVDGVSYKLPKGAVIIRDKETIIDLCGIKGGQNSGTYQDTKTIVIRAPVEVPVLIRRTSVALGLRSEASSIFERGVNKGGTLEALARATDLILELAGGEIASSLYDIKEEEFKPWRLELRVERLNKILGIEIPQEKVLEILASLNLAPVTLGSSAKQNDSRISKRAERSWTRFARIDAPNVDSGARRAARRASQDDEKKNNGIIECSVPTYRNDLQIEEDLIEEVARHFGYNNFPKTLPIGQIPTQQIPYFKNYRLEEKVKSLLTASGFSEIYTYSLVSDKELQTAGFKPEHCLRIDNPVSREFEYLRPSLKPNLIKALVQNKSYSDKIELFELGKVYLGSNLDKATEQYFLSGITNAKNFYEVKGVLQRLYAELGVKEDPTDKIQLVQEGIFFELSYSELLEKANLQKTFKPLPKFPPIIEDLAITASEKTKTGEIIETIKNQSKLISEVSLLDQYKNTRTFHIVYQDPEKNLTNEEVTVLRTKILKALEEKFGARLKA